jgi:hypothetical protein
MADDAARVALGTSAAWITALGQVSGLLLALREAEVTGGAVLPEPFAGGAAMRAWRVATQAVSGSAAAPPGDDVHVVGRAARVLGVRVARRRVGAVADVLVEVTAREAAVHHREPEWLVAQLARVHGVLTAPCPASADVVWRALDDPCPA